MKTEIKNNLNNPPQLEALYRQNKTAFKKGFDLAYPEIQDTLTAQIWKERLQVEPQEIAWGVKNEMLFVIVLCFIAGLIAQIPRFTNCAFDYFYSRNSGFVVFPILAAYFAWKQTLPIKKRLAIFIVFLVSAVYINLLPNNKSDTVLLACLHLPLFMWALLGYTFVGGKFKSLQRRIEFLTYNGDLMVMTVVILLAEALLAAVSGGLFRLIGIDLEKFYATNIVIGGVAAAPIVGAYLIQSNPQLVKNVSPIIAKVFTPVVLFILIAYLIAVIYIGKDPYNDREFLMIFNFLLIGVMAIILFSVAETKSENKINRLLLFALSMAAIMSNGVALSAIVFRISEWGMTPNRLAVLGGNILILINLSGVTFRLFKSLKKSDELVTVENGIASFLPIYAGWAALVTFLFPLVFRFK